MSARIVLLVTSPRLPAGLLTAQAWRLVLDHPVLTAADSDQTTALRAAGARVSVVPPDAGEVLRIAGDGTVVWLAGPLGDPDLARDLGMRLTRAPGTAELELVYGSWDPPGARLLDAVAVLDRLVSPGGDPWKRAQTHRSLAPFLLEEAYEAYDAILEEDLATLREELGDVLLQVVLHARLAEEAAEEDRFTVDDVAGELVDKLIRRNPHVFSGAQVHTLDEITDNWEQIKRAEKGRTSALDGIALAQPALSLAVKVLTRVERANLPVPPPAAPVELPAAATGSAEALGVTLLALAAAAHAHRVDPELALRRAALAYAAQARSAESAGGDRG